MTGQLAVINATRLTTLQLHGAVTDQLYDDDQLARIAYNAHRAH